MLFDRGSSADYNRWEKLGNRNWGWRSLLPYFKKVGSMGINLGPILTIPSLSTLRLQAGKSRRNGILHTIATTTASPEMSKLPIPLISGPRQVGHPSGLSARFRVIILTHIGPFIEALAELDIRVPNDGASGEAYGGFYVTHSQDPATATRSDARTAYFNPVAHRPNLHVLTGHRVTHLKTARSRHSSRVTAVEVRISIISLRHS